MDNRREAELTVKFLFIIFLVLVIFGGGLPVTLRELRSDPLVVLVFFAPVALFFGGVYLRVRYPDKFGGPGGD
jgi:NhaP-type Na+/H+ or K+/H+ antiporter